MYARSCTDLILDPNVTSSGTQKLILDPLLTSLQTVHHSERWFWIHPWTHRIPYTTEWTLDPPMASCETTHQRADSGSTPDLIAGCTSFRALILDPPLTSPNTIHHRVDPGSTLASLETTHQGADSGSTPDLTADYTPQVDLGSTPDLTTDCTSESWFWIHLWLCPWMRT